MVDETGPGCDDQSTLRDLDTRRSLGQIGMEQEQDEERVLGRTPSRIELSENEQKKLLGILDNAVLTPYEDSFAFK